MTNLAKSWKKRAIQNHALATVSNDDPTFGEMPAGPTLFGANPRAQIVAIDPIDCAANRTKTTCTLVKVCRRIIPKPTC